MRNLYCLVYRCTWRLECNNDIKTNIYTWMLWPHRPWIGQNSTICSLLWRHNERDGVSNHQPHDHNQPFIQAQIKENFKAPRHCPLCGEFTGDWWIPPGTGEFPAQRPVTRKMFPFDDVIMCVDRFNTTCPRSGYEMPIHMLKMLGRVIRSAFEVDICCSRCTATFWMFCRLEKTIRHSR